MRRVRGRHEVAAGARDSRLVVPAVPRARPPLLVVLHGCLQDADDIARGTRLDVAAVDGGVVLYPSQDVAANARRCWNWFEPAHQSRDGGEPAILAAMIDHINRIVYPEGALPFGSEGTATLFLDDVRITA